MSVSCERVTAGKDPNNTSMTSVSPWGSGPEPLLLHPLLTLSEFYPSVHPIVNLPHKVFSTYT